MVMKKPVNSECEYILFLVLNFGANKHGVQKLGAPDCPLEEYQNGERRVAYRRQAC